METIGNWSEIGERVAEARRAAGMSQGELAVRLGLDRTMLVRIESGERKISAVELFRLAEALGVPAAHFVTRPPAPLVSRRHSLDEDADGASRTRFRFDALLEAHARDAQWLIGEGFLVPPPALTRPDGLVDPGALAQAARATIGRPGGPLGGVARVAEQFGLYLLSVDAEGEGASLLLDGFGVAVVGGRAAPGRRRWTAAHELGHHLLQDEYHSDLSVAAGRDEREELIDRFAEELLIRDADLREEWRNRGQDVGPRTFLIEIAARYRVSWGAVVHKAARLGLVSSAQARQLRADTPTRGDLLSVHGAEPVEDLTVGTTGPQWRKAVLDAWAGGDVTGPRAVELLHGAITVDDLPLRRLEEPAP